MLNEKKSAIIFGATGGVGEYLVSQLLDDPLYDKVTIITRRAPTSQKKHTKLHTVVWKDFANKILNNSPELVELLKNHYVVYCSLGASETDLLKLTFGSKKAKAKFKLVDLDIVSTIAKAAKQADIQHFSVISSPGANLKARFSYLRFKGQMEKNVKELGFSKTTFIHPHHLMKPAKQSETGIDKFFANLGAFFAKISPAKQKAINVETVAQGMNAEFKYRLAKNENGVKIITSDEMRHLIGLGGEIK